MVMIISPNFNSIHKSKKYEEFCFLKIENILLTLNFNIVEKIWGIRNKQLQQKVSFESTVLCKLKTGKGK